jgi:hypothetical protein
MSTQANQLGERVIVTGRAYVRIIEAADLLLDYDPIGIDRVLRAWRRVGVKSPLPLS